MRLPNFLNFIILFPTLTISQVSFQPYQTIPTTSKPEVVRIGDVNNDGMNDVLLATSSYASSSYDYKLFVFTQNASGSLNSMVLYPYPSGYPGVGSIDIADINNDNLNDVIIGYTDSVGIFYQNISGTLDPIQGMYSGNDVNGTTCGDLNNDGLTDIAVSHRNDSFIRIFIQTPSGFTSATYTKPPGGYDEIDVGDVNNDSLLDVIFMAGQITGGIHVYTQNTLGTLNNFVSYFPSGIPINSLSGIAIGDLNNDFENDVVATRAANSPNAKIVIWYQDTLAGLLQGPPLLVNAYDVPEPIEIDDLNCDGKNEIVVIHGGWIRLSVYEQDSSGIYNSYQLFNIPYASHYKADGLSLGDYNNDGKKDVAMADYNNGLVLLYNNSICLPVGESEIDFIESSNLFPNPSNGRSCLHFGKNVASGKAEVFNVFGERVLTKVYQQVTKTEINLDGVTPGVYFIYITNDSNHFTKKLIIRRTH